MFRLAALLALTASTVFANGIELPVIVTADGRPAASVDVWLVPIDAKLSAAYAHATTDADGRALFGKDLIGKLWADDKFSQLIAVDRNGNVLRSWGKGLYVMPHAIRVDHQGNVWTTDAASSHVIKFSPQGKVLLDIVVGGQPSPCANNFCSTTDIAFAANGHVFISDGYANARVLEYSAEGQKLREWGTPGTGPGQFKLLHSIQIDPAGLVYVADRENGRVQRFDQTGKYLG